MLAASQSTKKFERFYRKKTKAQESVSLDDLACLVRRLSVQVDDLEHWMEESNQKTANTSAPPVAATAATITTTLSQSNSSDSSIDHQKSTSQHIVIDPWASTVPQNYGAILQRLEEMESQQKCPNECCASATSVSSADGVPWPEPIEPFRPSPSYLEGHSHENIHEILDIHYTHWCTLMRCLPLMDPITSAHVKTVGLYAMREILKSKANQRREEMIHPASTTRLTDSLSYLSIHDKRRYTPDWSSPVPPQPAIRESETKIAIETEPSTPPPVPPKMSSTETTTTPTPSSFPSPNMKKGTKTKVKKWLQLKKGGKIHDLSSRKLSSFIF
ncbi:hypothetical protein K501DRAFT_168400 [Backusella circina FSU 941]|nr:hypothetical protein K501DRAFT_168400 [Backusella circina FSU 941]